VAQYTDKVLELSRLRMGRGVNVETEIKTLTSASGNEDPADGDLVWINDCHEFTPGANHE